MRKYINPAVIFNTAFCTTMRLLPQKARFKAALVASEKLLPFIKLTATFGGMSNQNRLDGPRETALMLLLETLTAKKIKYDLELHVIGTDELNAAVERGKGVMFITVHGLSRLNAAFLITNGYNPKFISAAPDVAVYGTKTNVKAIVPGPNYLFKVANMLKNGEFIGSMADVHPIPNRYIEMHTAAGTMIINTPIFKIAQYSNANILFSKLHIDNGKVRLTITAPKVTEQCNEFTLAEEFATFLRRTG